MPKLQVNRSIKIDAPVADVFSKLNNFNNWQPWSPWLVQEPEAKVTVAEDTKSYSWEGNRIGSGKMKIEQEEENKSIHYDLVFLKPWKSKAKTWFELSEEDGGTKAIWYMDSSLPFFMFWMKKMMNAFIGMDYERGLNMLKDYVERGSVPTEVELKGVETFNSEKYVIRKTATSIDNLGTAMQKDLGALMEWAENNGGYHGYPITIYHKWDMVKRQVEYSSGVPVKELPASVDSGFHTLELPQMQTYTIVHKGEYKHLGNAWSTGMNLSQNKVFKQSKAHHPFEVYITDPTETKPEDTITEIRFPVK